ncbi:MAG: PhoH family protein [Gammaproteobacteria bacterium]|nr:MAG: PhoH family protein [Gammaproteobacteria bacterium]RLA54550.1 MAG: PhoH family protein [Gammaproteobacteria bacterium]
MNTNPAAYTVTLEPNDTHRLAQLCGQFDEHLQQIEQRLNIQIKNRGNVFALYGDPECTRATANILQHLYDETRSSSELSPGQVHLCLQQADMELYMETPASNDNVVRSFAVIRTKKGNVTARGENQQHYVHAIQRHDINFGVGPAGTGKTYLAVACAVESFLRHEVERILLVRPAVEAGEKLGFLPGDLSQKVDPYLRPLFDALYEMMGVETVGKLIERNVIEVAPLAYMRGRTLNNAFIILDESQNTTREQMKMFLTRIGFGSTAVITGDVTQIDLPRGTQSGLVHGCKVLDGVAGISFTHFESRDVVRHPLVQKVVDAYASYEKNNDSTDQP